MREIGPVAAPKPPLSGGGRFIRGFQRVGIVAAGVVFLGGLGITLVTAMERQTRAWGEYNQAKCVYDKLSAGQPVKMREYDKSRIDYDASGCFGPGYGGTPTEVAIEAAKAPASLEFFLGPFFIGAGITTVCSALTFGLFWLVGWLCAGFTRD